MSDPSLMRHVRHIHLAGIGGSGMCGIAEVLLNQGFRITGSDLQVSPNTKRLVSLGATVYHEHAADNIENADVVVASSALAADNVELVTARDRYIPVISRAEMLGELMRHRYGIAVAGTHGKTTTTSLITSIFQAAGLDPTYVIGGLLKSEGKHAGLGLSKYIVAEADESDASFLYLKPMLAVITNIDHDHMETYDHDFDLLRSTFEEFVTRLPFYGAVVVCIDDPEAKRLADGTTRPVLTYGFDDAAAFRAVDLKPTATDWSFRCERPHGNASLEISLSIPGMQNVRNALAAIATATDEGIEDDHIVAGIANFRGVGRRFEVSSLKIDGLDVVLVDDYGHHPTELAHVIETAQQIWSERRIVMVYQPHRFTRTRDLFHEFVDVLGTVDELFLLETYSAGEQPIEGADVCSLGRFIEDVHGRRAVICTNLDDVFQKLVPGLRDEDVLMIQGAGNVSVVSDTLKSKFSDP